MGIAFFCSKLEPSAVGALGDWPAQERAITELEKSLAHDRPRSLIQRWFDSFRQGGLERLLHKGRGKGTPSRLTAQAAAALRQKQPLTCMRLEAVAEVSVQLTPAS